MEERCTRREGDNMVEKCTRRKGDNMVDKCNCIRRKVVNTEEK
jgi:hypothetical protein